MTRDGSTQTDEGDSLMCLLERLPDRQLHTSVFWRVAKERFADALACVAHPALAGPTPVVVWSDAVENEFIDKALVDDIVGHHLVPDVTLADARCDLCKHRYFPLRATSVAELERHETLVAEHDVWMLPWELVADMCGVPTRRVGTLSCAQCNEFWSYRMCGPLGCDHAANVDMQGEWLRQRWPIDIGHGGDEEDIGFSTDNSPHLVRATVCLQCVRDRPALELVRLAVPEELRRLVPDSTYFWLHARRLTAEGVRSLL